MKNSQFMDTYQLERRKEPQCFNCNGLGEYRGGGMLMCQCHCCGGTGYSDNSSEEKCAIIGNKIDKRSKEYKQSINELIKLGLSKKEAESRIEKGI